jgi:coenzyme F420-dependent glucose-6-phosphate dehydrogenase
MTELGYTLSSEEFYPADLVRFAQRAEEAGFGYALVSDHYHPWIDKQGSSPFVWAVIGSVAQATERLRLGTGVTCPTMRVHPAIVAQAAATCETLMPGRFFLGVGTGENLNEHILGDRWPPAEVRREMLEEAVAVIRLLWQGGSQSHHGAHYTVENARIYTLPEKPPPLMIAASGPRAAEVSGRLGDGFIGVAPDAELIKAFEASGGKGKPRIGQVNVCYAEDEASARRTAHSWWPNAGIPGELSQELPVPAHFEQAAENVSEDDIAEVIACGPDPERHLESIGKFEDAGYDHVYVHQIGPDQESFFGFYEREVLPRFK